MKRTGFLALVLALFLSACIPALPQLQPPTQAPVIDVQLTDTAMAGTHTAETLNALPTPTLELVTDTPEPTATDTESPTAIQTATETLTPDPNLTHTATGTVTVTGTPPTVTQFVVTATETLHPRFFGTRPPAIPYGEIKLVNKSETEAYISLQCKTIDGYTTILEYPVYNRTQVSAPAGNYNYVAWVGGRQFLGSFSLSKGQESEIVIDKDKITVR